MPGITVHRNCTSSMSSIQLGFYQIMAGEAKALCGRRCRLHERRSLYGV
ncbi:MAG: hypothetical protein ACLR0P_08970 [Oscillospiraceae bacterium]